MEYTEELKYIHEKISELRIKTELSRNTSLIKFLNKYEEFENSTMANNFKIN